MSHWIKIKKILLEILVIILAFSAYVALLIFFNNYQSIFTSFFNFVFMSYLILKIFSLTSWISEKRDLRRLRNSQIYQSNNKVLYQWLGKGEYDSNFFFQFTDDPITSDPLRNLKKIKRKIHFKIGSNLEDYYLLKNYIEVYEKNNLLSNFSTIFIGIIVAVITTTISRIVTTNSVSDKIMEVIFNTKVHDTSEKITMLLDISTFCIIGIAIIIYSINEFSKEKRRLELIKLIIGSIISDYEKNKK